LLSIKPAYLTILVCALVFYVVDKGVLPAFRTIDSDFPNYYVAAKIIREGNDPARLYDDGWFQQQIHASGIRQLGKFSPFPPATALVLLPLTGFSPLTALRIVTVLNLLMVAAAILLLARCCAFTLLESSAFVLLSGIGLVNCIRFGQLYIAVSLLMVLGFFLLERRQEAWAGACLALPVPFKYFPAVYLAYFGMKGKWKILLASAAVVLGIFGISVAFMGWQVHAQFFRSILPRHLQSDLSPADPFSVAFQSWDSLLRRLFVYDAARNPHPVVHAWGFYLALKAAIILCTTAAAGQGMRWAERNGNSGGQRLSIALLGIWGLLIAPATATYHFILLWLPVGCLLAYLRETGKAGWFCLSLSLYAGIGFVPYAAFRSLAGQGVLSLAAYPRLWLTCALFFVALAAAHGRKRCCFDPFLTSMYRR